VIAHDKAGELFFDRPRAGIQLTEGWILGASPTAASVGLSFPVKDLFELGKGDYLAERWLTLAERAAKTQ
jgi:hypothetical protein